MPHQLIAYAWPSGPWYVVAQAIGLPDWVAHRLWVGTIMLAAGTGVAWAAHRRLGFSAEAALAAGLLYQLSPYLVPYVSRTSSMPLPWAALGWIVGLDDRGGDATRWRDAVLLRRCDRHRRGCEHDRHADDRPRPGAVARRRRDRAHDHAARRWPLRRRASAGWPWAPRRGGYRRQRHPGPPRRRPARLLGVPEDVSLTATSSEARRSLGYWLMYVRDPFAPTTTAERNYMADLVPIVCGFVLVIVALIGLAVVSFPARRFAIAMTFTGLVLAVGVHLFSSPSLIARLFRGEGQEGLSLALRSSTRAPTLLAIGWRPRNRRPRRRGRARRRLAADHAGGHGRRRGGRQPAGAHRR